MIFRSIFYSALLKAGPRWTFLSHAVQHFSRSCALKEYTEPQVRRRVPGKSVNLLSDKLMIQRLSIKELLDFFFFLSPSIIFCLLIFFFFFTNSLHRATSLYYFRHSFSIPSFYPLIKWRWWWWLFTSVVLKCPNERSPCK